MTPLLLKCLFAASITAVTLIAGWYPFKKRAKNYKVPLDFPIGETLATGVFLGAALLHMLPEANNLFISMNYHYPVAFIITGITFLFFLWFEHLGRELYHHHHDTNHPAFAVLAWVMLSIHSLMLGAALGFNNTPSLVIMLFLAIIVHKWAESFAISMQLNKSSLSHTACVILFLSFSLMTATGIALGSYFGQDNTHSLIDPVLMSASAGTFLYLGTLHGLERGVMVKRCCNLRDFSFVIIGFFLMASVAVFI